MRMWQWSGAVATCVIDGRRGQIDSAAILPSALIMLSRFRKPKSPDTTPLSPAEVQKFLSKKKLESAIASSVASSTAVALPNISDMSSGGATGQGWGTVWKAAYGGAKIAVETIKESSDLCPALRAVTGAISVLIKNCDVSKSCS